ncbi:MAG: serine/threonine protein kinase, partial [Myxococcales bacterium]|nr:serine/threonine protein kinase [Myxococcales bacterium]
MSEGEERTRREGPAVGGLSDDEVLARLRAIPRVGRFTIVRPLGEGGMGTVSVAYDEELDRKVALKMIRGRYADSAELRERFLREARALARLSHPNVVTIYEVGEDLGAPFLAMELVEGVDLRTWLRSGERSRAAITRVMIEAGRGLAAAHAAGIVHRDFKPQNVLVADDGRPRVVDFGLARELAPSGAADDGAEGAGRRLTVNGAILGTPPYMPREQLFGLEVDARCDVYAFGVTLYEALVGRRPFSGRTLAERRKEVAYPPAIDTRGLSTRLVRVLTRALAEAPDERYPSMDALL